MDAALGITLLVLGLPLAVAYPAFANPGGPLALLSSRRARYEHRHRLATRRWRRRARGRQRSAKISKRLRWMAEHAARHRCTACGAQWRKGMDRFPVDHLTPWIMGGLTCLANSALLCKRCNSIKSCYWVAPSGKVYYRGSRKPPRRAAEILAKEHAARRSPAWWLRAYGLLPSW